MEAQIIHRLTTALHAASSEPGNDVYLLEFTLRYIFENCPKARRLFRIFIRTMELTLSEVRRICYDMMYFMESELYILTFIIQLYSIFWKKDYGGPYTIISICFFGRFREHPHVVEARYQLILLENPHQSLNKNDFFR